MEPNLVVPPGGWLGITVLELATKPVKDTWLNPGEKIYMVNGRDANPGGWATNRQYTSLEEARNDLSLLKAFTDAKGPLVIQEYTIKGPIPVREGHVGALKSTTNPSESYPGGGLQWELLLDKSLTENGGWRNFLTLNQQTKIP